MTDTAISLTRLDIRTGATPDWLYLHAITLGPWQVAGRLWALLPIVPHLNYEDPQTHFDPDSAGTYTLGGAPATGTLHLDCGCSRQVTGIGSEEDCAGAALIVFTGSTDIYEREAVGCGEHGEEFDRWDQRPDPLESLAAPLTLEELTTIRNAVTGRRDGIAPMSLAGLYGAAGVRAVETVSLDAPDLLGRSRRWALSGVESSHSSTQHGSASGDVSGLGPKIAASAPKGFSSRRSCCEPPLQRAEDQSGGSRPGSRHRRTLEG